jgi:hypothetical protein
MTKGLKSSEFIGILIFVGYLALTVLFPGQKEGVVAGVAVAQGALPGVLDALQALVAQVGDQTLLGGLLWAYIKRRSGLKESDLEVKKLEVTAAIEKYRAICATQRKAQ